MEKHNNQETYEAKITDFLEQQHKEGKYAIMGGTIEDYMREKTGAKGGTVSRICRFMVKDKKIEPEYIKVEGIRRKCVAYRLVSREIKQTEML